MRSRNLFAILFLSIVVVVVAAQNRAQSAQSLPSTVLQLKQVAYLKASNAGAGDHFGCGGGLQGHAGNAVAISRDGSTIAFGAHHEKSSAKGINGNQNDDSFYSAGAVYVFVRSGDTWAQQAYIKASNTGENDNFGYFVALSADGNTLAVTAQWEDSAATGVNGNQNDDSMPQSGAAYVFVRTGNTWSQQAYIKASNTGRVPATSEEFDDGDQFGTALTLSGDGNTLAIGAISEDSGATGVNADQKDDSKLSAGAVYVFARRGASWAQQVYLKPKQIDAGDLFGFSLALSANGNVLAVGHYEEDGSSTVTNGPIDENLGGAGAICMFNRNGTTWTQTAYLKSLTPDGGDSLGAFVAISDDGNTIAANALDEDTMANGVNAVRQGDRVLNTSSGAAYVFVNENGMWKQQASFKPSNIGKEDWFGVRFGLSGDGNILAIAGSLEDSAAQGIDGNQEDNSADEAGAVYLFTRSGGNWTQQAYIKGSNTQAFDEFGSAVAVSRDGRTMVITARGEDSAATGVNGNQADNSADEAGAAYVFAIN
jgi:hypothetical protein